MTSTTTHYRQLPPPVAASGPRRSVLMALTMTWCATLTVVGMAWLTAPQWTARPRWAGSETVSVLAFIPPVAVAGLMITLGTAGAVLVWAGTFGAFRRPERWLAWPALGFAVVFALVIPDLTLLIGLGYALALFGPIIGLGLISFLAMRHRVFRWVLLGVLAVAAVVVVSVGAGASAVTDTVGELGEELPSFLGEFAPAVLFFVGGILWLLVALRSRGVRLADARPAPFRRPARDWGWWVTVAAAACPLLFMLQRLSWLTPWPIAQPSGELESDPGTLAFGLTLGFVAGLSAVMILGLISRWGAIYPHWVPGAGGQPVSPGWPTATAVTVGLVITVAGRSMWQAATFGEVTDSFEPLMVALGVVLTVWGPLLIAAGVAYFRRRTNSLVNATP